MGLFSELKRRNVFRVAIAYLISAWLLIQLADILVPMLTLPDWVSRLVLLILVVLFVPILIAAWALELTPEGLKLEKQVDRSASITPQTGKRINAITIGVLALAVLVLLTDKFFLTDDIGPGAETAVEKSIAVLPFSDLSQGQDQGWFADGLAEEILNALARAPDLLVASRTSSFGYKGSDKDLRVIASELGVAHILEGSVRRTSDRLRVTAQLIRASDGFHLWSENYDRNADDIIDVQEDLALKIASAMQTTMDPEALRQMLSAGTHSVDAYQAYLRGMAMRSATLSEGDPDAFLNSYDFFEEARRLDPNFSAAHLKAASFWNIQGSPIQSFSGLTSETPEEIESNFVSRMDQAIATAPNPVDQRYMEAEKAFHELRLRRALELMRGYVADRPNDLDARSSLIDIAAYLGEREIIDESLGYLKQAGMSQVYAVEIYMNDGYRFGDASAAADYGLAALQRWPENNTVMYQTHRTLMWARRPEEAAVLARRFTELFGDDPMVRARQACMAGRGQEVYAILQELMEAEGPPSNLVWLVELMLDDKAAAESVPRYYAEHAPLRVLATWLSYHKFDPTPFPELMAVLQREGAHRPPAARMPYTCPVTDTAP